MDEITLKEFRELLESRMKRLLDEGFAPYSRLARHDANDPMDSADLASHHRDQALVHTIQYRNQQLVHEIRAAIERINDGEFGVCGLCSCSIGFDRLQARPTAMLCIHCQQTLETVRRRFPGARRRWAVA